MTTAIEMITDALRLVNVIDGNEVPGAKMGVSGLRSLNDMLKDWEADGIRLGWQTVAELDDTLPLRAEDHRGVKFNLAVELGGTYGLEPPPRVNDIAMKAYTRLEKAALQHIESDLSGLPCADAYSYGMSIENG